MSLERVATDAFCRWVIAKDYYDGPMSGIALQARDDRLVFFRVVAWDTEQWERVFAIASISSTVGEQLRAALTKLEPQREPFWLPGPQSDTLEVLAAWADVLRETREAQEWRIVESHDLLGPATERLLSRTDSRSVADMVYREAVMDLGAAPLLDAFVRQLQANAG